jgi:hypothetical protein
MGLGSAKKQRSGFQVSGKALAAGSSAALKPAAAALPLSHFFADPKCLSLQDACIVHAVQEFQL